MDLKFSKMYEQYIFFQYINSIYLYIGIYYTNTVNIILYTYYTD